MNKVAGPQGKQKPTMFVLVGANGSGKSTLYASKIKPVVDAPFINADVIQKNELKNPDMRASTEAAQIAASRIQDYIKNKKSFVRETVFSHSSKLEEIKQAQAAGFEVALYHVGVRSADLNVDRVAQRVKKGGHNVPENKIRERRERGEALISEAARLSDHAFVYDNSNWGKEPQLHLQFEKGKVISASNDVPKWQCEVYANDLERFLQAQLNPAAASYQAIDEMAKKLTGNNKTRAQIPQKSQTYKGALIGESAQHYLQKTSGEKYVAHFKTAIGKDHKLGHDLSIAYDNRRNATTQDIAPKPGTKRTQQYKSVSIKEAQILLKDNTKAAQAVFEKDLIAARQSGASDRIARAEKRLSGLKLAPTLLNKLRQESVSTLNLPVQQTNTPVQAVNSVIRASGQALKQNGLTIAKNPKTPSRGR